MNETIRPGHRVRVYAWTGKTLRPAAGARALLRCALVERGFLGEEISDLVLAVSELVANATEHATGPYELWLQGDAGEVVCEVHDHDPRVPVLPASLIEGLFVPESRRRGGGLEALLAVASERGRGLQIVEHLSEGRWGFWLPGNGKKIAWIEAKLENN